MAPLRYQRGVITVMEPRDPRAHDISPTVPTPYSWLCRYPGC
jgi:hypothetical protein